MSSGISYSLNCWLARQWLDESYIAGGSMVVALYVVSPLPIFGSDRRTADSPRAPQQVDATKVTLNRHQREDFAAMHSALIVQ